MYSIVPVCLSKTIHQRVLEPVAGKLYGYRVFKACKYFGGKLLQTVQNIIDYISIRRFPIFAYSMGAVLLKGCRVPNHLIAQALIPSFLFYMFFADGQEGARELVVNGDCIIDKQVYHPDKTACSVSKELKRRYSIHRKILKKISPKQHKDWDSFFGQKYDVETLKPYENILIHGLTGVGKSDYLKILAKELEKKGHRVFFLRCDKFSDMGSSFKMLKGDPRSLRVRMYLNWISLFSKKPPVLVIDDGKDVMNPSMPGMGTDIKDGNSVMKNRFSIIFAMAQDPANLDSSWDEALRRFLGNIFELKPLEKEGLIHLLLEVKKEKFEKVYGVKISDGRIKDLVERVIANVKEEHLWIDCASRVLTTVSRNIRAKRGPKEGVITIDEKMINKSLENQNWYGEKG